MSTFRLEISLERGALTADRTGSLELARLLAAAANAVAHAHDPHRVTGRLSDLYGNSVGVYWVEEA